MKFSTIKSKSAGSNSVIDGISRVGENDRVHDGQVTHLELNWS